MTMPNERYWSLVRTERLLIDIINGTYKRVPKEVKDEAKYCLRHYPTQYEIETYSKYKPE